MKSKKWSIFAIKGINILTQELALGKKPTAI